MKKLYISALLAVAAAMPVQAKVFGWGIEGGVNMSKMDVNNAFSSDNRVGWFIGPKAQVTIPVAGLSIDAALQYSQSSMGINSKPTVYGFGEGENKTLPYIVVPVNIKYALGLGSTASVYVATGPQWNWYVGDKSFSIAEYEGTLASNTFSWNVGVGVHLLKHLQVGVNYNVAFGKSFAEVRSEDANGLWNSAGTWKNNTWQLRLAYMF